MIRVCGGAESHHQTERNPDVGRGGNLPSFRHERDRNEWESWGDGAYMGEGVVAGALQGRTRKAGGLSSTMLSDEHQ